MWLSKTSLSIHGSDGLRPLCSNDCYIVDQADISAKQKVANGCWTREVWRMSNLVDTAGNFRYELNGCSHWDTDEDWISKVKELYLAWIERTGLPKLWKLEATWDPREISEHSRVAILDSQGDPLIGIVTRADNPSDRDTGPCTVTVRWQHRQARQLAYNNSSSATRAILDTVGGRGPQTSQQG